MSLLFVKKLNTSSKQKIKSVEYTSVVPLFTSHVLVVACPLEGGGEEEGGDKGLNQFVLFSKILSTPQYVGFAIFFNITPSGCQ